MTSPQHVAAGVIADDRGVLVTRRPDTSPMGGLWEFPGGKVRAGEDVAAALRRELREELGIEAEIGRPLAVVDHTHPEAGALRLHFLLCRIAAGEPSPLAATEMRWLPPPALAALRWPPADTALVAWLVRFARAADLWYTDARLTAADR